jgi:hypothetical protein
MIETPHLQLDGDPWRPDTTQLSPRRRSSTALQAMGDHCLVRMTASWMAVGPGLLPHERGEMAVLSQEGVQASVRGEGPWLLPQEGLVASAPN